jgi:hypothetical protein
MIQKPLLWLYKPNYLLQYFSCARESPKVRGFVGRIEQAERGAIRKSPQAHTHFCTLLPLPTAMAFVLVQV